MKTENQCARQQSERSNCGLNDMKGPYFLLLSQESVLLGYMAFPRSDIFAQKDQKKAQKELTEAQERRGNMDKTSQEKRAQPYGPTELFPSLSQLLLYTSRTRPNE